jgi:hypothetical protein
MPVTVFRHRPIFVTGCDLEVPWHIVREIRMEIILTGSWVLESYPFILDLSQTTITISTPLLHPQSPSFPPHTWQKPKQVHETTREYPYSMEDCYETMDMFRKLLSVEHVLQVKMCITRSLICFYCFTMNYYVVRQNSNTKLLETALFF